jgi:hypothetical protein
MTGIIYAESEWVSEKDKSEMHEHKMHNEASEMRSVIYQFIHQKREVYTWQK